MIEGIVREYLIDYEPKDGNGELFEVEAQVVIDAHAETIGVEVGRVRVWIAPPRGTLGAVSPWVVLKEPIAEWLDAYLVEGVREKLETDSVEYDATLAAQNADADDRARDAQAGV